MESLLNHFPWKVCPIGPLLYAIVEDALGMLTQKQTNKGNLCGIVLPDRESQLCLQLFSDDTNGLIRNNDMLITTFQECLQIYYIAYGSRINHERLAPRHLRNLPLVGC